MNDSQQREQAIAASAIQLPANQREAYLQQACGEDIQMRQRVAALIGALEHPERAFTDTTVTAPNKMPKSPPKRIARNVNSGRTSSAGTYG